MPEAIANGTGRRLMHTRTVECNGYLRDDDLWEVEAARRHQAVHAAG